MSGQRQRAFDAARVTRWRPPSRGTSPSRRDLRRAALFLWMTPLFATRSSTLTAFQRGRFGLVGIAGGNRHFGFLHKRTRLGSQRLVAFAPSLGDANALLCRLRVSQFDRSSAVSTARYIPQPSQRAVESYQIAPLRSRCNRPTHLRLKSGRWIPAPRTLPSRGRRWPPPGRARQRARMGLRGASGHRSPGQPASWPAHSSSAGCSGWCARSCWPGSSARPRS